MLFSNAVVLDFFVCVFTPDLSAFIAFKRGGVSGVKHITVTQSGHHGT